MLIACKKDDDVIAIKDIDGNVYHIVTIGTQVWMVENLKTTRCNDGISIFNITDSTQWSNMTTPAYCWYLNDEDNYKDPYGALYNWYTVETGKICPTGWHVPTDDEWTTLIDYLGGERVAGGKLKEKGTTHWESPNSEATNESGFTALPNGFRFGSFGNGSFKSLGFSGYWWSSTEYYATLAWVRGMVYDTGDVYRDFSFKDYGYSVRCVRD